MIKQFVIVLVVLLFFADCRFSPQSLLEQSSQIYIIEKDGQTLYGLAIYLLFYDSDKQILEKSFQVDAVTRELSWMIDDRLLNKNDGIRELQTIILSDSLYDFYDEISIKWQEQLGRRGSMLLKVQKIGDINAVDKRALDWLVAGSAQGEYEYAWSEDSQVFFIRL